MDTDAEKRVAPPALSVAAITALRRGRKIEAIKITRIEQGIDLKAAKDAVEEYIRSQPALLSSLAKAQAQGVRRVMFWFAAIIGTALLIYQFLMNR